MARFEYTIGPGISESTGEVIAIKIKIFKFG